ncbi:hypothetical protein [Bacillus sp. FJAT-52991]|uniref:Uncharacterized protein n=1 Tax=Bacillus kandeliae TaxID=3129297 RepID=A0ABZ2NA60_9BACI
MNYNLDESEAKKNWMNQLLAGVILYGSLDKALTEYMIKDEENFSLDVKEWLYINK